MQGDSILYGFLIRDNIYSLLGTIYVPYYGLYRFLLKDYDGIDNSSGEDKISEMVVSLEENLHDRLSYCGLVRSKGMYIYMNIYIYTYI